MVDTSTCRHTYIEREDDQPRRRDEGVMRGRKGTCAGSLYHPWGQELPIALQQKYGTREICSRARTR